jgi:hypothetical protein
VDYFHIIQDERFVYISYLSYGSEEKIVSSFKSNPCKQLEKLTRGLAPSENVSPKNAAKGFEAANPSVSETFYRALSYYDLKTKTLKTRSL